MDSAFVVLVIVNKSLYCTLSDIEIDLELQSILLIAIG
jgi:hypothetical protein